MLNATALLGQDLGHRSCNNALNALDKEVEHCMNTHLDSYSVINTEPEEQQGTEEQGLKEGIQGPGEPAVHQE